MSSPRTRAAPDSASDAAKPFRNATTTLSTNAKGRADQGRRLIARIDIGGGRDVVVSRAGDLIDVRIWTATGNLKFPSKHGLTIPLDKASALIAALRQARRVSDE